MVYDGAKGGDLCAQIQRMVTEDYEHCREQYENELERKAQLFPNDKKYQEHPFIVAIRQRKDKPSADAETVY